MGATHKETATELVKAMIQSGQVPPAKKNMDQIAAARSILKRSIYLVKYGIRLFENGDIDEAVQQALTSEWREQEKKKKKQESFDGQGKVSLKPQQKNSPRVVKDFKHIEQGQKKQ